MENIMEDIESIRIIVNDILVWGISKNNMTSDLKKFSIEFLKQVLN